jgi:hypothetical protein
VPGGASNTIVVIYPVTEGLGYLPIML